MYDVVDLKISNEYLIEGSELKWGFGQVLAVLMMGMIIFNIADAVNGKFFSPSRVACALMDG